MNIVKRGISLLLFFVIMFGFIPTEYLPDVSASAQGGDGALLTNNQIYNTDDQGAVTDNKIIFRVVLSRSKENFLNGTEEERLKVIETYKYKYPDMGNILTDTMYFVHYENWTDCARGGRGPIRVAEYVNSVKDIQYYSTYEYNSRVFPTSRSVSSTNAFKDKAIAAYNAKTIRSINDLANGKWNSPEYLPSLQQAKELIGYIFQRQGDYQYKVAERLKEVVDKNYQKDPSTLNESEKFNVAVGYAGLLTSLYVLAKEYNDSEFVYECKAAYRESLISNYETAIEEYFVNANITEKPVSLIIDTCQLFSQGSNNGKVPMNFVIPSMDLIEFDLLASEWASIRAGDAFIKEKYPAAKGNTDEMILAMARQSVNDLPYQQTSATKTGGPIRYADHGTRTVNYHALFAWTYFLPYSNRGTAGANNINIKSDNAPYWLEAETVHMAFMDALIFDNKVIGFMIASEHIANPLPTITFEVEDSGSLTRDFCATEVTVTSPNRLVLRFSGDSGLISSLLSRKEDADFAGIKLETKIYRTEYEGSGLAAGTPSTPKTEVGTLEGQVPKDITLDEMVEYLQGKPIILLDTDIMTKVFTKVPMVQYNYVYIYEIDVKITIDKAEYEFKSDDIVMRDELNNKLDKAIIVVPGFYNDVPIPEDIVITKPSSTTTTDIINPSENENLEQSTQMIKRYEYISVGAEFAEVKNNEPLKEQYEVMGGVPSSEELYFSVGGSEFKMDVVFQYWVNEHSRDRTYTIHFDSNICEYNNQEKGKGDSWEGIDLPSAAGATSQDTTRFEHATGTSVNYDGNTNGKKYGTIKVTAIWTGQITNEASPVTESASTNHGSVSVNPKCPAVVNNSAYVTAVSQANQWMAAMGALTPQMKWRSASDKEERFVTIETMNIGTGEASTTQADSRSGSRNFSDRGIMIGSVQYSFSNPADTEASDTKSANCSDSKSGHSHGSATATATASPDGPKEFKITVTYTISAHALCGPCCEHVLPDVWDTWRQGAVYDVVKFSQGRIFKLDQGRVKGMEDLVGTDTVYANIVSGQPTYFMNIAVFRDLIYRDPSKNEISTQGDYKNNNPTHDGSYMAITYGNKVLDTYDRRKSESSRAGRLRYILDPNAGQSTETITYTEQGNGSGGNFTLSYAKVAAPEQHDDVIYDVGKRSMNCDGMATTGNFGKNSSTNAIRMDNQGHSNDWADGILYTNIQNRSSYSGYFNSPSSFNYTPKEMKDNDTAAMDGTYYEDYNHHIVRTPGVEKSEYSDKADDKDKNTAEWQFFDKARRTKIICNVISDFIILQTSGGDQAIFYYEKESESTEAQEHFQKIKIPEEEMFTSNELSIWIASSVCSDHRFKYEFIEDYIVVGGYNGRYDRSGDPKNYTESSIDKYKPYSLIKKEFLPFAGAGKVYDANKKTGTYQYWGGSQIKTILDDDPAKTISRPIRQATDQKSSFKIIQKDMQIVPTTANQIYEPYDAVVWYSQVFGGWFHYGAKDAEWGLEEVQTMEAVSLGVPQREAYAPTYVKEFGESVGLMNITKYYRTEDEDDNVPSVNPVIVYTPVSTEDAMILQQEDLNIDGKTVSRDQRVNPFEFPDMNDMVNKLKVCPRDPALCEYRQLHCTYHQTTALANFDFNSVPVGSNVVTDNITGIQYTLPEGFTIESGDKVGDGNYLHAKGTRWSIPFNKLGLGNSESGIVQVSMDLTVDSDEDNLMLVGFQNYGLAIDTNKETPDYSFFVTSSLDSDRIGVRKDYTNSDYNDVKVDLTFSLDNVSECDISVNGVPISSPVVSELRNTVVTEGLTKISTLSQEIVDTSSDRTESLTRSDVGSNLNIGSWGQTNAYQADYYIDNLSIAVMSNGTSHTSACYQNFTVHAKKMIHEHESDCWAKEDIYTCDGIYNDNYQLGCGKTTTTVENCTGVLNSGGTYRPIYSFRHQSGCTYSGRTHYSLSQTNCACDHQSCVSGQGVLVSGGLPAGYCVWMHGNSMDAHISSTSDKCSECGSSTGSMIIESNYTTHTHTSACYHKHVGTAGLSYANGCYTNPTKHTHNLDSKVLNCSYATNAVISNFTTSGAYTKSLSPGKYKLEVWGASGGDGYGYSQALGSHCGLGGYSYGELNVTSTTTYYIFVGGAGSYSTALNTGAGYNGGGNGGPGGYGGGGMTHISTTNNLATTSWNPNGTIIVAGGGGGADDALNEIIGTENDGSGGYGGGLIGGDYTIDGVRSSNRGGTQSSGYRQGVGQSATNNTDTAGAGGGWYGGYVSNHNNGGGAGGSGYVSSILSNAYTTAGSGSFPKPTGTGNEVGHAGNGYAKISHLHTDSCYKTVTCTKIAKGSSTCTGILNTLSEKNVHKHNSTCLTGNVVSLTRTVYQYTGKEQEYIVPYTDDYEIEVYGAKNTNGTTGYGKATVRLQEGTRLYITIGTSSGDGLSDIRTVSRASMGSHPGEENLVNDFAQASIKSRLIVAGKTLSTVQLLGNSVYPLKNGVRSEKGGNTYGTVIITPKNVTLTTNVYNKIINGSYSTAQMKEYLGETVYALYINSGRNSSVILNNLSKIPTKVNGNYNPIWACKFAEMNAHVCKGDDGTVYCYTYSFLNCTEPHHKGGHYVSSNPICWEACNDDSKHVNTKKSAVTKEGTNVQLAEFLQLDAAFTVYFPNIGNFEGNNALGLAQPQTTRGFGYKDNCDTTEWTREKRVRFPFDVIYEDENGYRAIHAAHTWIDLDVPTVYFHFYLLVENPEMANVPVEFEVEAINCDTSVGTRINSSISYSGTVKTLYQSKIDTFLQKISNVMWTEVSKGYQIQLAKPKGQNSASPLKYGLTGYENMYVTKETGLEEDMRTGMKNLNTQLETDFEGASQSDKNSKISPHLHKIANMGINNKVKPITKNDNYIRVDNKFRQDSFESLHGGYKKYYLDVIGRIGNFAIVDTEDFRFSNFFKMPIVDDTDSAGLADLNNWLVEGLVLKVDDEKQNLYVGDMWDLRGNKASVETRWLDTYGTESWMAGTLASINSESRDINKPNLKAQILTGDVNNIDVLKQEQLRFGYDALTSIVTFGSYATGEVQVVPKYYALKLNDNVIENTPADYGAAKKNTYIPLDVYIDKDGLYQPVNIFNNAGNGLSNKEPDKYDLYDYVFNLNWLDEAKRRNYTIDEKNRTHRVAEYLKIIIYDYEESSNFLTDSSSPGKIIGIKDTKEIDVPLGRSNYLGTSQYVLMTSKHRTFIGDSKSYGGNVYTTFGKRTDFGIEKNTPDAAHGKIEDQERFEKAVQRWHGKLGLPSSSVFVPHGETVTEESVSWVMNDDYAIVCTAEVMAIGDVWTIYYSQPWFDSMSINGKNYSTGKHYPGHRKLVGEDSIECPDCLPPIVAVYSAEDSSIEDVEIVNTH